MRRFADDSAPSLSTDSLDCRSKMQSYRIILGCVVLVGATGCHAWHAWHEPPLEPVSTLEPPIEFGAVGPPVIFGPPAELGPDGADTVILPPCDAPYEEMPWAGDSFEWGPPVADLPEGQQNPLFIPVSNHEAAWKEIVDVVDDYFRIAREEPVHAYGGVLTEGRIATRPISGATHLEPHRCDSVGRFNRWESTLQTIRRKANARVVPTAGGLLVEMIVEKELEDLPRPEHSTAGAATFRTDGSLRRSRTEPTNRSESSDTWIPLGRDPALEQRMLADIRDRLDVAPPGVVY